MGKRPAVDESKTTEPEPKKLCVVESKTTEPEPKKLCVEEQESGSETEEVEGEQKGGRVSGWDEKKGRTTLDPIEYLKSRKCLDTLIATYTLDSHGVTFLGYSSCGKNHFCGYILVHSESSAGQALMELVDAYCRKEAYEGYDFFNEMFEAKRTPGFTYRQENVFGWDYAHIHDMNRLVTVDEVKMDIKHVIESFVEYMRQHIANSI
jgi:hypothetical protein